ncbi:hypothetical protein BpHYR1_032144 [Brachionus plicatilis]|uniref:Uncharacterized protein n=1 Tax=Brachionus plicatilis TaxID=10195 RepID=A0A3M7P287_BRAPC|nr:hypothetical protein BpHYR1_032144 [Brachionus plicatilis]
MQHKLFIFGSITQTYKEKESCSE